MEAWVISPQCLETINNIAEYSNKGGWDLEPHVTIELAREDTTSYVHLLLNHDMMCFFTDRCLLLPGGWRTQDVEEQMEE